MEATLGQGWGFSSRLFILPAIVLWRVAVEAEVAVVRLWSADSGMAVVVALPCLKIESLFDLKVLGV